MSGAKKLPLVSWHAVLVSAAALLGFTRCKMKRCSSPKMQSHSPVFFGAYLLALLFIWAAAPLAEAQNQLHQLWQSNQPQWSEFGEVVANVGDTNGDGFDDITAVDTFNGHALLLSGLNGRVLHAFTLTGGFLIVGIDGAGDINGDGFADVALGDPGAEQVKIYSGRDGVLLRTLTRSDPAGRAFGGAVAGVGDVNGDGTPDIAVGVPATNIGGTYLNGYVRVFSGANGAILHTFYSPRTQQGSYGQYVSKIGDADHDGYADILVSEHQVSEVFLYSGRTGRLIFSVTTIPNHVGLGYPLAAAGDVNGDTYPDFIAGGRIADVGGVRRAGYALVISGAPSGNGAVLHTLYGVGIYKDYFGAAVAGGVDVNNDNVPDIVVATSQKFFQTGPGYARVFSGANGNLLFTINGNGSFDALGYSVAMGRFDVDEFGDVAVGAPGITPRAVVYSSVGQPTLMLSGPPLIGTTVTMNMASPGDAGHLYAAGFSTGTSPGILLPDTRLIPLNNDWLLGPSLTANNGIFVNSVGNLNANGNASVQIVIPNQPFLMGQTIHAALVVIDLAAPFGVRRISRPLAIPFQ